MNNFTLSAIGYISSCFKEKFTIPRQPRLLPSTVAELVLEEPYSAPEIVRGLEGFSHIWIIFAFHAVPVGQWKPTVRPPRLGGNKRVGVFATRSTHRPNPVGLSVVDLLDIQIDGGKVKLILGGCDFLDGTPVLDIKPYLPYVDSIPEAQGGFAPDLPEKSLTVTFSESSEKQCTLASERFSKDVKVLISELLALDPRPAYRVGEFGERIYATHLYDFNLRWRYLEQGVVEVVDLDVKED
ncbi:tRNA (N6-threonylcarbamoyladenosine(37)-N6)-methyltransferase TrmO [Leucothrix arctica]|uniref:tRNA (N6-threonylcarbamoyladenosine(37)-N6)-methyltransferase TrmO n=1 Tax=Leucothrix arctica TaxID=1481894 RepID=A0A317C8I6_9GAMM|nr:tRNA (N6-threonylcarbamoyladenosine(37)-N6)-methyltransferase TrmO [Leucothrix arctica]PWQ94639.1 tRNA (N6-threonylcarbamoyladenosine(37)-N6)-methyltransferase TrmO [Leucothrix arctica]